jgi:hypothetical protein
MLDHTGFLFAWHISCMRHCYYSCDSSVCNGKVELHATSRGAPPSQRSFSHAYARLIVAAPRVGFFTAQERRLNMQRLRTERLRTVVLTLTIGFAPSLALTGCDSGSDTNPIDQAKVGQEAAKSSMDYMRKRHAELKTAPRTGSKPASPGR